MFDKKNNQGINYYSSSLALSDNSSKVKLIKSIDEYIANFKEKNKYKLDVVKKDPKIKALKKVKARLLENNGDQMVNGRTLPKPNQKVLQRIHEINNKHKQKKKRAAESCDRTDRTVKDELSFRKTLVNIVSDESNDNMPPRFKSRDELETNFEREKKLLKGFQVHKQ